MWPVLVIMPSIGLLLSGLITWLNVGFTDDFTTRWMRGFLSALPVMVLALTFMAVLDRWVQRAFAHHGLVMRKIILALMTACMMELLMASAVTLSNRGLAAGFVAAWVAAFAKSLPLGVCISLVMGFVIKPRIDRMMARAAADTA